MYYVCDGSEGNTYVWTLQRYPFSWARGLEVSRKDKLLLEKSPNMRNRIWKINTVHTICIWYVWFSSHPMRWNFLIEYNKSCISILYPLDLWIQFLKELVYHTKKFSGATYCLFVITRCCTILCKWYNFYIYIKTTIFFIFYIKLDVL